MNYGNKITQIIRYKPIKPILDPQPNFTSLSIDNDTLNKFIHNFFKYIFINLCNCVKEECIINTGAINISRLQEYINSLIKDKQDEHIKCNLIYNAQRIEYFTIPDNYKTKYIRDDISSTRLEDIDYVIDMFIKMKLLFHSSHGGFFLFNENILSWESIKKISTTDITNFYNKGDVPKLVINTIYNLFCDVDNVTKNNDDSNINIDILLENEDNIINDNTIQNIQVLEQITIVIRCIFWYLRKMIIDSLLIFTLSNSSSSNNEFGLSIGSTKLSSDYDITIYGETNNIANVIDKFNKTFEKIFKDPSSFIFDTNLYGISFIILKNPLSNTDIIISPESSISKLQKLVAFPNPKFLSNTITCDNKEFQYIQQKNPRLLDEKLKNYIDETSHSQHVWAIIKLINLIRTIDVNENTFNTYLNYMDQEFNKAEYIKEHYQLAKEIIQKLNKFNFTYTNLLHSYDVIKSKLIGHKGNTIVEKPKFKFQSTPSTRVKSPLSRRESSISRRESSISRRESSITSPQRKSSLRTELSISPEKFNFVYPDTILEDNETIVEDNETILEDKEMTAYDIIYSIHINYISLINYYGDETYFTKGAFLDIVVNSQMCHEKKIALLYSDYIDSFIENIAELILHQKTKYINRAEDAIKNVLEVYDYITTTHYTTYLDLNGIKKCIDDLSQNKNKLCINDLRQSCIYIIVKALNIYMNQLSSLYINDQVFFENVKNDLKVLKRIVDLKETVLDID